MENNPKNSQYENQLQQAATSLAPDASVKDYEKLAKQVYADQNSANLTGFRGAWDRGFALFLDLLIWALIPIISNAKNNGTTPSWALWAFFLGFPLYIGCFEAFGATIGELLLGLRVVDKDTGKHIGILRGLVRGVAGILAYIPGAPWLAALVIKPSDKYPSQWRHDSWTNSIVIYRFSKNYSRVVRLSLITAILLILLFAPKHL